MTSYTLRLQLLAAVLAALAGYVDALGFLATGGFFVSFMSGNSTRLGVGLAQGMGATAAGLIGSFLAGVIVGALLGHHAGERRRAGVLGLAAILLATSAASGAEAKPLAAFFAAAAMGVTNNVFARNGEVSVGVTYMTGSLVKLGQRLAGALLGTDRTGWLSYLTLWLGFLAGVAIGAVTYPKVGVAGLWFAAGTAGLLAVADFSGLVAGKGGRPPR